ncbi:unnamed protein product [marine sediment metagenome]|uniref:Uncharacterized protein n=2 Tax=marine sediment metagenome TaxID=412755 RepID=X0Z8I9_9ZZZZ
MSLFNHLATLTKRGIKKFIGVVTLANRSYHMDDYMSATTTTAYKGYRVGTNNQGLNGSQEKTFVSKSTLIMCTEAFNVKFNHSENVVHYLQADTWFVFEQDIHLVMYALSQEAGTIYIHFEGVLPIEGRVGH